MLAAAQRLLDALQGTFDRLLLAHRRPLERRERLRDERIDGERQRPLRAALLHIVLEPPREVDDCPDVLSRLERQADHQIEAIVRDARRKSEIHRVEEMLLLNALVDDGAHALAPRLRRHRERLETTLGK